MDIWRCSTCSKTKSLAGPHLDGKMTVRSDCWPCAKKRTFVRESPTASRGGAPVVTAPFLFGSAPAAAASSTRSLFTAAPNAQSNAMTTGNPFLAAAAAMAATTGAARGTENTTPPKALSSSSGNVSPIVMHSAINRPAQSPPFTFTASSTALITPSTTKAAPSANIGDGKSRPTWLCSVCKKVKELSGDHLKGKTTVRSDCWPCGIKRTFVLSTSEPCGLNESPVSLPFSTTTTAGKKNVVAPSENTSAPFAAALWRSPLISANDTDPNMFLPTFTTQQKRQPSVPKEKESVSLANSSASPQLDATNPSLLTTFEGEVLRGYRRQLVDGIRIRTAWYDRTLYVLAPKTVEKKNSGEFGVSALGQAAVVFLAVEHKLAESPFRLMRRLFCPNEFLFAAACMYANTFLAGHRAGVKQSSFVVYGPQVDPTVPTTPGGSIIEACAHAEQRVVGGEQRVEGAQSIFRNSGWLTPPLHAAAEAMRLAVAQEERQKQTGGDDATSLGVDVVLVAETMRMEELSQAAALALPVKPFS